MATKRKSGGSQGGSTLYGVLAGLLIGLVLAAAVAFYVTKAPVPFVDRATRQGSATERPMDPRTAPDPNLGLYGRDGPAGLPPTGPTATTPVPLPSNPKQPVDDLGALIATLPSQSREAPAPSGTQAATPAAAPKAAAKPAPKNWPAQRLPRLRQAAAIICRRAPSARRATPNRCAHASCCWGCLPMCSAPRSAAPNGTGCASAPLPSWTK